MAHDGGIPRGDVRIGRVDFSESAGTRGFNREDMVGFAESLGAGLVNAAIFVGCFNHCLAFGDGHARWLFGIDVLAGPHRENGGQRMPVVAGGDQDTVKVGALG